MKLSIITVNLNNAAGLQKTIESVVSQTFTDFEYLIIDGGSTDGSVDVIKQYTDKITYWASEPDKGIYQAINKGIMRANGEYILVLNSGDCLINPEVIQSISGSLANFKIIYGNIKLVGFDDNMAKESILYYHREWGKEFPDKLSFSFFINNALPHQATFVQRDVYESIGLYDETGFNSDWKYFMIAICRYNVTYKHIDTEISLYDINGISSKIALRQLFDERRKKILAQEFPLFIEDYEKFELIKKQVSEKKPSFIQRIQKKTVNFFKI